MLKNQDEREILSLWMRIKNKKLDSCQKEKGCKTSTTCEWTQVRIGSR